MQYNHTAPQSWHEQLVRLSYLLYDEPWPPRPGKIDYWLRALLWWWAVLLYTLVLLSFLNLYGVLTGHGWFQINRESRGFLNIERRPFSTGYRGAINGIALFLMIAISLEKTLKLLVGAFLIIALWETGKALYRRYN